MTDIKAQTMKELEIALEAQEEEIKKTNNEYSEALCMKNTGPKFTASEYEKRMDICKKKLDVLKKEADWMRATISHYKVYNIK